MKKIIRLGTRGSPLALTQAEDIRNRLYAAHAGLDAEIEIVPIRTTGDWKPEHKERRFADMGGNKGLFTKEIEEALAEGYVDLAVHSMKDVASFQPEGLRIAATPERADPRDAFISRIASTLAELPKGAAVGASSLRRQAQILAHRPDLRVVPLRGNVETRLKKLEEGIAGATILAVAGLARLGMETRLSSILPVDVMLPASSQGALGVEIRASDDELRELLARINHQPTFLCVAAERAVMARLTDRATRQPEPMRISMRRATASRRPGTTPDGVTVTRLSATGNAEDAEKLGADLGEKLRRHLPPSFFAA